MGVFTRFADIINANVNALLDEAEDPHKMVLLITREMEETLVQVRCTSAKYIADKKEISKRLQRLTEESDEWERKAELAINRGRDDLAKAALREKASASQSAELLQGDLDQIGKGVEKLQSDTGILEEKLKEARTRQRALILRGQTATSRLRVKRQLHDDGFNDVMDRFSSYERKLDEVEGQLESYDIAQRSLSDEISQLESGEEIDKELQALKAKLQAGDSRHAGE
jgi:phage shock protein A